MLSLLFTSFETFIAIGLLVFFFFMILSLSVNITLTDLSGKKSSYQFDSTNISDKLVNNVKLFSTVKFN